MVNEGEVRSRTISTTRMEAFSDGVFAIAITLLVLEISVPEGSEDDLLRAVLHEWPSYLAYVVSFATIGGAWLAHNVITEHLKYANASLMRLNLLLLMVVSFLPFPTRLLAGYIRHDNPERVAATIYGVTLLVSAAMLALLWIYAIRAGLVEPDMTEEEIRELTRRLNPGLIGYVVLIVVGLFVPLVAVFGYFFIALNLIVPIFHITGRERKVPSRRA
jgi:uncharacterized membrane protein